MNSRWVKNCGSVLVGLLWCLTLLSLLVISLLYTSRLDVQVVKNYGDLIQARYLALAGVEKAKALLYQDSMQRRHSRQNHTGRLYDDAQDFRDIALGRGKFRVFHQASAEDGGNITYGISDEESRLNVNSASADELGKLEGLTPDMAAAIIDWRDTDNEVTPGGAEADYYMSLRPPYLPRNGPFQTIREMLMVRGVTRGLLLGRGQAGASAAIGSRDSAPRYQNDSAEGGWSALLTVDSGVKNVNAAGDDRINIQSADESALAGVPGFTSEIAKAIVAWRGQNRLETLADLLDVRALQQNPNQANTPPPNPPGQESGPPDGAPPANSSGTPTGEKLISEDLLLDVADELTTDANQDAAAQVNINTAPLEVLICLAGIDRQLAHAIISYRESSGFLSNIAWLLRVPGMTRDLFKQIAPRVTARSETFRIISEGKVNSTGARQRIQAIVRVGSYDVVTLSYREDQ